MSKTNYLQAVISDLQRTAGPYKYATRPFRGKQLDGIVSGGFSPNGLKVHPDPLTRDRRLPLRVKMARTPIHPGEHLAEELKELGMSAAAVARDTETTAPHRSDFGKDHGANMR
jgi:hypothetical protein